MSAIDQICPTVQGGPVLPGTGGTVTYRRGSNVVKVARHPEYHARLRTLASSNNTIAHLVTGVHIPVWTLQVCRTHNGCLHAVTPFLPGVLWGHQVNVTDAAPWQQAAADAFAAVPIDDVSVPLSPRLGFPLGLTWARPEGDIPWPSSRWWDATVDWRDTALERATRRYGQQLLHADLIPSNIGVQRGGTVVVVDLEWAGRGPVGFDAAFVDVWNHPTRAHHHDLDLLTLIASSFVVAFTSGSLALPDRASPASVATRARVLQVTASIRSVLQQHGRRCPTMPGVTLPHATFLPVPLP